MKSSLKNSFEAVQLVQLVQWNMIKDAISEKRVSQLHPEFQALARKFIEECEKAGYSLRVTYGLRTNAEQDELYAQGRTKPGAIITHARAGQSPHNYAAAIDVVFMKDGKIDWNGPWDKIGAIGERLELVWGGSFAKFKDRPHFEWKLWKTLIPNV